MISSFFNSIKRTFIYSGIKPLKGIKTVMTPKFTGLIVIAFTSILFVGCNNDTGGTKEADPANQTIEQRDDNKEGSDTTHAGMDHNASGMDTMHQEKQK